MTTDTVADAKPPQTSDRKPGDIDAKTGIEAPAAATGGCGCGGGCGCADEHHDAAKHGG